MIYLSQACQTCVHVGMKFNCDHAMICKTGGLVSLRHNELCDLASKTAKKNVKMWKQNPVSTTNGK